MKKLLYIPLVCTLCVLISSYKNIEYQKGNLPTVLIFENAPCWRFYTTGGGWLARAIPGCAVFLYEDGTISRNIINRDREFDTLVIPPVETNYVELSMVHNSLNILRFYIKTGDTIRFTFDEDKFPILKSYTSERLTQAYNLHRNIPSRISFFGFEPITIFTNSHFWYIYQTISEGRYIAENRRHLYDSMFVPMNIVEQQVISYLKEYAETIEKLRVNRTLSREAYRWHHYMLQYKQLQYDMSRQSFSTIQEWERLFADFFTDDRVNYFSYLYMLNRFRFGYTNLENASRMHPRIGIPTRWKADYPTAFDEIATKNWIPPKTQNHILFLLLLDIIHHFSVEDALRYKERYIELTGDTIRANSLFAERGVVIQPLDQNDIEVKDKDGNEFAFRDILEQLRGKVIYVDFWASWCGPCRASKPDAFVLRQEYEGRDVAFVYLAINDRSKDAWKTAVNELQLNDGRAMSFFITNGRTSRTIQELQIQAIPRYLIFDKTGKLVNPRAPGPSGTEIRELLNKLLSH